MLKKDNDNNLLDGLAMMRADLEQWPDVVTKPEFRHIDLMARNFLPVGKKKLQDITRILEDYRQELFSILSEDDVGNENVEFVFDMLTYLRTKESELKPIYKAQQEQIDSVIKTTQMFAHDVRKPFSMIQAVMQKIESCESMEEINLTKHEYLKQISNSLQSVNHMIQDVLDMGGTLQLNIACVDLKKAIKESVKELLALRQNSNIDFSYEFLHTKQVAVDFFKLQRVLQNLIINACEAMQDQGKIWFKSQNDQFHNREFVKLCIGNTSFIPESEIPHLFDAFYSYNKETGTGLGLAIARKIINAHGGEIWCQNDNPEGVEFWLRLPCTDIEMIDGN